MPCSCCKAPVGCSAGTLGPSVPSAVASHRGSGFATSSPPAFPARLLNANKINCVRADAFQDLQNLSLLSLYDNKIQSLAKGTFTSLRAIQTL